LKKSVGMKRAWVASFARVNDELKACAGRNVTAAVQKAFQEERITKRKRGSSVFTMTTKDRRHEND
jgi:hypothetical protein